MISTIGTGKSAHITYVLDHGAKFVDKTEGAAKGVFAGCLEQSEPRYKILINGFKVICPVKSIADEPDNEFLFVETTILKVKDKGSGVFKITQETSHGKRKFYVDTKILHEGAAYDLYNYMPRQLDEAEAVNKYAELLKRYPPFTVEIIAYNRHGVCVFGSDQNGYGLYWAKPDEQSVQLVECKEIGNRRDGSGSYAKSEDGFVNFQYNSGICYLNSEVATML